MEKHHAHRNLCKFIKGDNELKITCELFKFKMVKTWSTLT